jgi:hypothetical protein
VGDQSEIFEETGGFSRIFIKKLLVLTILPGVVVVISVIVWNAIHLARLLLNRDRNPERIY